MDKIIHRVGLLTNRRDIEVKEIIDSVYEFMIKEIEEKDFLTDNNTNFFHQFLGRFYFKRRIYNKINKIKNEK